MGWEWDGMGWDGDGLRTRGARCSGVLMLARQHGSFLKTIRLHSDAPLSHTLRLVQQVLSASACAAAFKSRTIGVHLVGEDSNWELHTQPPPVAAGADAGDFFE